jgi:hypothetical protein
LMETDTADLPFAVVGTRFSAAAGCPSSRVPVSPTGRLAPSQKEC